VCSDIPIFREIGGKACHYFDLHAESELDVMVATVCNAMAEPARRAGRLERFSLENVAREYVDLYMKLRESALGMVQK
jgi:hypothetical protein